MIGALKFKRPAWDAPSLHATRRRYRSSPQRSTAQHDCDLHLWEMYEQSSLCERFQRDVISISDDKSLKKNGEGASPEEARLSHRAVPQPVELQGSHETMIRLCFFPIAFFCAVCMCACVLGEKGLQWQKAIALLLHVADLGAPRQYCRVPHMGSAPSPQSSLKDGVGVFRGSWQGRESCEGSGVWVHRLAFWVQTLGQGLGSIESDESSFAPFAGSCSSYLHMTFEWYNAPKNQPSARSSAVLRPRRSTSQQAVCRSLINECSTTGNVHRWARKFYAGATAPVKTSRIHHKGI